jgi:hypothetical protein
LSGYISVSLPKACYDAVNLRLISGYKANLQKYSGQPQTKLSRIILTFFMVLFNRIICFVFRRIPVMPDKRGQAPLHLLE